jgi:hypothetical protein
MDILDREPRRFVSVSSHPHSGPHISTTYTILGSANVIHIFQNFLIATEFLMNHLPLASTIWLTFATTLVFCLLLYPLCLIFFLIIVFHLLLVLFGYSLSISLLSLMYLLSYIFSILDLYKVQLRFNSLQRFVDCFVTLCQSVVEMDRLAQLPTNNNPGTDTVNSTQ